MFLLCLERTINHLEISIETVNNCTKNLLPTDIINPQDTAICHGGNCKAKKSSPLSYIKGTSLCGLFRRNLGASMTVEASVVLPLFLFFFLNLLSAIEMIRLHSNIQLALWSAGREISVYGSFSESESYATTYGMALAEGATVKLKIKEILGKEYLENSPLENGLNSLYCMVVPDSEEPDVLDIRIVSKVAAKFPLPAFGQFSMINVYYSHYFTGYEKSRSGNQQQVYYVTQEGEVYHVRQTCSYLYIPVEKIMREELPKQYRECQKCGKNGVMPWVFITSEGECFHAKLDCPALKRTIRTVTDTTGYRPCSRCASIGGEE